MPIYRVLLADDEEEIREGIIKKIEWENIGYTIVGDAENGVDALEKAEHLHPDVVITDIKMPFMDGLELGKKLREIMPSTKLIIFSGFDDFEYAQKAIKINAAEYILKPINSKELTETLKKLKKQLDCEYDEKRDIEILRRNYKESLPVMREQFLVSLIEGKITTKRLNTQASLFDINLEDSDGWAAALIRADYAYINNDDLRKEEELIPISLKCTAEEILKDYCESTVFVYSDNVAIIAKLKKENGIITFINGLNEICKTAQRVLSIKVMAGVGTSCKSLLDIRHSYREAENAMDYSATMGDGKAIYIADIEPDTSVKFQFDEHDEREIANIIKMGSEEDITNKINELFFCLESKTVSISQYQIYLLEMMTSLFKLMRSYELNTEEILGKDFKYVNVIASLHSPAEMKRWSIDCCKKISVLVKRERMDSTKLLAQNAKRYIQENYSNSELSVEDLCNFLHVSPAYFSTVFKRETGMTFVAYLTEVRLDKAVNLLNKTDYKTYIIADKVGYTEPNYFSYVFKKRFGVSPSKYRNT